MLSISKWRNALTRFVIAGGIATGLLTALSVPATAEPTTEVAPADPQTYNFADCYRPELKDDKAFQDWCTGVRWANDPANPANPNSPLNPNNMSHH
ncbi:hypothetical protein [Nocardia tengchongensis]|uniref:hypothetical protein n=1 Tax=Nocardia tengchongensis TaxID=2055889 RepID=UPI003613BE34